MIELQARMILFGVEINIQIVLTASANSVVMTTRCDSNTRHQSTRTDVLISGVTIN